MAILFIKSGPVLILLVQFTFISLFIKIQLWCLDKEPGLNSLLEREKDWVGGNSLVEHGRVFHKVRAATEKEMENRIYKLIQ